jgi:4-amino-4-deoxy-L-arabinose transferase-like glycosyltransferase
MPRSNLLSGRALLALFLAFALVWMGTLGYRKLIGPDEGRYAEISREMALAGDWVTPRLNGIKYFEKPPLQYWATAATFKAIGESEFAARFWTGLTGLSPLLAWIAGRRLFGEAAGLLAAAVAGSSLLFNFMGHINTLDMGLAAFLHLALTGFLLAQGEGSATATQRRWMLAAWAGLALAVLSTGLVALVLTGATLVLYSLVTRDFSPWA